MIKWIVLATAIGAGVSTAAVAPSPVTALAGRYSEHGHSALVTGETYETDDVAEIVPVDLTHAYVRFSLAFYNGHSCSISGVARAENDALIYTEPAHAAFGDERCSLKIKRSGAKITWSDDDGSCKAYCGARGSFHDGDLPWSSKRAISYLPRLKRSSEYRQAIAEWRTGHAQR